MKFKTHLIRNLIFFILIAIFIWYIFSHRSEFNRLINALQQGSWRWLLLAGVTQGLYYCTYSFMTQSAFSVVHLKRKFKEILPLVFGALFVNVLAPTGGQSGTILFADDAARRKESSPKAIIANVIATSSSYLAFSLILIFSIFYLRHAGLLNTYEIIGSIVFIFPTVLPIVLIFTSFKNPNLTLKLLSSLYRFIIRFSKFIRHPSKLSEEWPKRISDELAEAALLVTKNKKQVIITLIIALIAHAISILSIYVIFIAFDYKIHYGALIAGYTFGEVARIISPQPEGIGVVEIVMTIIFTSFGVAPIQAAAISIVFRGFNFWVPLGIGFLLLKRLKSFSNHPTV
jgi:phosphatidylglycerol lysyltransferase